MTEFFQWMDQSGHGYVVLRGFQVFDRGFPAHGAKEDVDLLVEDAAVAPIRARYHGIPRRRGVKCDVYNVSGADHGGYQGHSYYPKALADFVLQGRVRWNGLFFVPDARAHLLSLLYHIAYQKQERSKIHIDDPAQSVGSKYIAELDPLAAHLGLSLRHTLLDYHRLLREAGHAIPYPVMTAYLQRDFAQDYKGLFMATVAAEQPGEMNMFVIRRVAVETGRHAELIAALRAQYRILMVKDIPFVDRLLQSRKMRGGKWRRGGVPCIAVLVFDPSPQPTTAEDRKVHPFVLNSRQFMKRALREKFTRDTGRKASQNPLHSTDNEAEALGHLPLFFSAHEQEDILFRLGEMRRALPCA